MRTRLLLSFFLLASTYAITTAQSQHEQFHRASALSSCTDSSVWRGSFFDLPQSTVFSKDRLRDKALKAGTTTPASPILVGALLRYSSPAAHPSTVRIPLYDSLRYWHWDTLLNGWEANPYRRVKDISYDSHQNELGRIEQVRQNNAWVNDERIMKTYDHHNNNILEVNQEWDGFSWKNVRQFIRTYDARGNLTTSVFQLSGTSGWRNMYRSTFTYNANSDMTSHTEQYWDNTSWADDYKETLIYDSRYNLILETDQNWNGWAWENHYQYIYTYDSRDQRVTALSQHWAWSSWENQYKVYFYYDSRGNLTGAIQHYWTGGQWSNDLQIAIYYDAYDNIVYDILQSWNGTIWENWYQDYLTYDSRNNNISVLTEQWDGLSWLTNMTGAKTYDSNDILMTVSYRYWNETGTAVYAGDSMNFSFHAVIGIEEIAGLTRLSAYPNPANDVLVVESDLSSPNTLSLDLKDVNGRPVSETVVMEHAEGVRRTTFPVADLPAGLYLLTVSDGRAVKAMRVIVHH
jgi:hypothetical protein